MAYKQVREILDQVAAYHRQLADLYDQRVEDTPDERLRTLLSYMGEHARSFREVLDRYGETTAKGVLDTWIQYPLVEGLGEVVQEVRSDASVEDILRDALRADEAFLQLYRHLASATSAERVRELFEALARLEEREERGVVRALVEVEEGT